MFQFTHCFRRNTFVGDVTCNVQIIWSKAHVSENNPLLATVIRVYSKTFLMQLYGSCGVRVYRILKRLSYDEKIQKLIVAMFP
jgi:hypothetical protein